MSSRKRQAMPSYYGKNIARNAQRKFFARKKLEKEDAGKGRTEDGGSTETGEGGNHAADRP